MYCPKCGTLNIEDAKFCRACGADISLVPQALTKSLPENFVDLTEIKQKVRRKKKEKEKRPPTLEKGLGKIFEGLAYLAIVAIGFFYFWGAILLWIWFVIPGLSCIGEGLGEVIRASRLPHTSLPQSQHDSEPSIGSTQQPAGELASRNTSEIDPHPFSVTEGTTRHLNATHPAKH